MGNIVIIGKPNVGKSTLFNKLIDKHLSAETNKPHTTRHIINGEVNSNTISYTYLDTPGINFKFKKNFNRKLNRNAISAIDFSDLIIHVVNISKINNQDHDVYLNLKDKNVPKFLVLNKTDLEKNNSHIAEKLSNVPKDFLENYNEIVPISCRKNTNIEELKSLIDMYAKNNKETEDFIFPRRDNNFFISEFIREAAIKHLSVELPYSLHVEIDSYHDTKYLISVYATIYVNKKSHLPILIGKNASMLIKINSYARNLAERYFKKKIFLKIYVRHKSSWKDTERFLDTYN